MRVADLKLDELVPSKSLRTGNIDVDELTESIREHGLLQPIRVRPFGPGLYQIIAGHRRFLAHRSMGLNTISAVVVEEPDERAAVQSIVENLQRENLTPLELATGVRELSNDFHMTIEDVSQRISKSPDQVRTWIRLSRLPDDVLDRLESGEGRTQTVSSLTPRHLRPFVGDLPSQDERDSDPKAAALYDERLGEIRSLQEEIETRGVNINAHMADAIRRDSRDGMVTVPEALDKVLSDPDRYRYKPTPRSSEELEIDTFGSYRRIQSEMAALAYKLRPEIASQFSGDKKEFLLQSLSSIDRTLESYRQSLSGLPSQESHQLSGTTHDDR